MVRVIAIAIVLLASLSLFGASGDITGLRVSEDGWRLYVYSTTDVTTNGTFASFGFATNNTISGNEKVVLTFTSQAHTNGVATTTNRTIYGTKAIRLPYPSNAFPDVTNNGTATIWVVALSKDITRFDSNITATISSGLYTGTVANNAVSGMAVTNSSLSNYRQVIPGWAKGSGYVKAGPTMELAVMAAELDSAREGRSVDSIEFFTTGASSGVVRTNLVTEMTLDTTGEVPTGLFKTTVDLTPFTQGELLRIDFRAEAHIGNTTSSFDTRDNLYSMPTHMPSSITNVCDKNGTFAPYIAVVSSTGTNATGAATNTTPQNVSSAHYFSTIAGALTAIAGTNGTVGGAVVYVKDSISAWLGGTGTYGSTPSCVVTITNYPGETVTFTTQTGNQDINDRIRIAGNIRFHGSANFFSGTEYLWFDSGVIISNTSATMIRNCRVVWVTSSSINFMEQGVQPFSTDLTTFNLYGCDLDYLNDLVIAHKIIGCAHRTFNDGFRIHGDTVSLSTSPEYTIHYNNEMYGFALSGGQSVIYGQAMAITNGILVLQNIFELCTNAAPASFFVTTQPTLNYTNVQAGNNVWVGKRLGIFYNDDGTNAAYRHQVLFKHSISDSTGLKGDDFNDSPDGGRVGDWMVRWNVGWEGNFYIECNTTVGTTEAAGAFNPEFNGLYSYHPPGTATSSSTNAVDYVRYQDRRAQGGSVVAGNGRYYLRGDSPARNIGLNPTYIDRRIVRYDLAGNEWQTNSPPGAYAELATYHVAKTGSDSNSGSEPFPWLTVQKAADTLLAGESVEIHAGTYAETATETTGGTASTNRITYFSDEGAILEHFRANDSQWITLDGLTFRYGASTNLNSMLRFENDSHNCIVTNCTFGPGIFVPPLQIYGMVFNSTFQILSNSAVNWTNLGFAVGDAVFTGGNTETNGAGDLINGYANQGRTWTIRGITNDVIGLDGTWVAETNTGPVWAPVHHGILYDGISGIRTMIGSSYGPTNLSIVNNRFTNLFGAAITLDGGVHTVTITSNRFDGLNGYKLIQCIGTNILFHGNLVLNGTNFVHYSQSEINRFHHPAGGGDYYDYQIGFIHTGGSDVNNTPVRDVRFTWNWFENIHNPLHQLDRDAASTNLLFAYNVFVGVGASASGAQHGYQMVSNTFVRSAYEFGQTYNLAIGGASGNTQTNVNIIGNVFHDWGDHAVSNALPYTVSFVTESTNNYNFLADAETRGFQGRSTLSEANGVNGGNPRFFAPDTPRGADGLPFTADDGLRPLPSSPFASLRLGALEPLTLTTNIPYANLKVVLNQWQETVDTNYNPTWWTTNYWTRTNKVRPYGTPESIGRVPCTVTFDASESISGNFSATNAYGVRKFVWNFGDGSTYETWRATNSHTFLWPGDFTVTLTVHNTDGNSASYSRTYRVLEKTNALINVYHVKTNGNNANAGTFDAPWLTIAKAISVVTNGDWVAVHPGNYYENSDVNRNVALQTNRITFVGYNAKENWIRLRHPDYTFAGFDLNGSNATGGAFYIFQDADRIILRNNFIHDTPTGLVAGVYITRAGVTNPVDCAIGGQIIANTFTNIGAECIHLLNGSNWVFQGNQAMNTQGEGDFIKVHGDGISIADNYCTNLNNGDSGGHVDFFQIVPASDIVRNITIERNWVEGNLGNEADDGDAQVAQIASSAFASPYFTNIVFRNNVFRSVRGALNDSMDGMKVYNNLFYRTPRESIQVTTGGGENGSSYGTDFKNNLFYQSSGGGTSATLGWYYNAASGNPATNTTVLANYNAVAGTNNAAKTVAPPDSEFRWASIGQEANGINGGDPLFVSASRGDFRLQSSSSLVEAGTAIADFTTDFLGRDRGDGNWDIGPFQELGLASPPPSPPTGVSVIGGQAALRGDARIE